MVECLSGRASAVRFRVHRREVRAALLSPRVCAAQDPQRAAPLTGAWHGWIREILVADRDAPLKQRHTAKRIRDRLAEEHGVLISESQCRAVAPAPNWPTNSPKPTTTTSSPESLPATASLNRPGMVGGSSCALGFARSACLIAGGVVGVTAFVLDRAEHPE